MSGVSALGMPFGDATGCTIGALSIATVNTRMTASRVAVLSAPLRRAVRDVERALRADA